MRGNFQTIIFSLSVSVLLLCSSQAFAARRVINEANIEEQNGCAVIIVRFNFPVRYRRHFPKEPAQELRIQFEPISMGLSDMENRFEREDVRFSPEYIVPLSEILFEGNISGGPFLTLTFERTIAYEVKQGSDFRSLVVTPFRDIERAECFPID